MENIDENSLVLTKICTICGVEFPANTDFFYASTTGRLGIYNQCKTCWNIRTKKNRQGKEEYYREYVKKYRELNKEKCKEYDTLYYEKNKEIINKKSSLWAKENPDKIRKSTLKCKYGVTIEDYQILLDKQNGVCAVCGCVEIAVDKKGNIRNMAIDHNHETGEIRGLLCSKCNSGLGLFNDSIENLLNAVNYLMEHDG